MKGGVRYKRDGNAVDLGAPAASDAR